MFQLQVFLTIVERGSYSAAAEFLHLSQPAITINIRALEEHYNIKLFYRQGKHMELTEAGRSLIEPARQLLGQAQLVEEHFIASTDELRGQITIACGRNSTGMFYHIPRLVASFRQKYPKVQFSLQQASEDQVNEMVLEREAHFGVINGAPRHKSLDTVVVLQDELVLVLPCGHQWAGQTVPLAALKGQPFLMRSSGSETRRQVELTLRSAGLSYTDLQIVAELDSAEGVALAAEAGLGIGFISKAIASRFASSQGVAIAYPQVGEIIMSELKRSILMIRYRVPLPQPTSPTQERFWDFVKAAAPFAASE